MKQIDNSEIQQIHIKIYSLPQQKFLATIDDGWWIAYGKTAKEASKRVEKRFKKETGYK